MKFDRSNMGIEGEKMDLHHKINPPCLECPYKLGIIKTVVNPCPKCKLNGYWTFEQFRKQIPGGGEMHAEDTSKL